MPRTIIAAVLTLITTMAHAQPTYTTERNIHYRDALNIPAEADDRCLLDIYYPTNPDTNPDTSTTEPFTTIIWLHAGGLKVGNKYIPGELTNQGFAVVAASYRLHPGVTAPAYIEDADYATAWTFANIERLGGSRDRIILAGASAGGYLAAMVALDPTYLAPHDLHPNQLAGLASIGGQMINHVAVRQEQGITRTQAVADNLSPIYHIRDDAPPTLLVTGDRELELLGRYEENAFFWRMTQVVGHPDTTLHELEGFDHPGLEKPAHGLLLRFATRIHNDAK
mgnify:CR=1 FL=1